MKKIYPCGQCNKLFTKNYDLIEHIGKNVDNAHCLKKNCQQCNDNLLKYSDPKCLETVTKYGVQVKSI